MERLLRTRFFLIFVRDDDIFDQKLCHLECGSVRVYQNCQSSRRARVQNRNQTWLCLTSAFLFLHRMVSVQLRPDPVPCPPHPLLFHLRRHYWLWLWLWLWLRPVCYELVETVWHWYPHALWHVFLGLVFGHRLSDAHELRAIPHIHLELVGMPVANVAEIEGGPALLRMSSLLEQELVGKYVVVRVSPPAGHVSWPGLATVCVQIHSTPSRQAVVAARPWVDGSIPPMM